MLFTQLAILRDMITVVIRRGQCGTQVPPTYLIIPLKTASYPHNIKSIIVL